MWYRTKGGDLMKRKTGLGSTERGKNSLRYLKRNYENTENCSSCDLAKRLIEKNVPDKLKGLVDILARVASKTIREDELRSALRMMGILVVYEIRNTGYNIEDTRNKRKKVSEFERVQVWKDLSRKGNVFEIRNYNVTYPKEKMKRDFEDLFFRLYGLKVEFNSPQQR